MACVTKMSGGFYKTAHSVLLNEIHLDSLDVHLERLVTSQRARAHGTTAWSEMDEARELREGVSNANKRKHPYAKRDEQGRQLLSQAHARFLEVHKDQTEAWKLAKWADPEQRAKSITVITKQTATTSMKARCKSIPTISPVLALLDVLFNLEKLADGWSSKGMRTSRTDETWR